MTPPFLVTAITAILCAFPLSAQTIYATEFEEFEIGNDMLIGPDFWQTGTSLGTGSHGIDNELVSGLGKSAFLGYNEPSVNLVTVAVTHSHDPLALNQPMVEFESILGIEDSSNNRRDTFSVIFLNLTGDLLAAIEFRNSDNQFGIWYSDGEEIRDTDVDFVRGELHLLTAQINFEENIWSAQLDGIDLFNEVAFHKDGKALSLGFTGAQWILSSPSTSNFGNNFLLIADWYLYAVPTDHFEISTFSRESSQDIISFYGERNFIYGLEYSDDLLTWNKSPESPIQPEEDADFAFNVQSFTGLRYYRVLRDYAPAPAPVPAK